MTNSRNDFKESGKTSKQNRICSKNSIQTPLDPGKRSRSTTTHHLFRRIKPSFWISCIRAMKNTNMMCNENDHVKMHSRSNLNHRHCAVRTLWSTSGYQIKNLYHEREQTQFQTNLPLHRLRNSESNDEQIKLRI